MQIIFGSIKYQLNSKNDNSFNIYYSLNEPIMLKYVTLVKQIFDVQSGIQVRLFIFRVNNFILKNA